MMSKLKPQATSQSNVLTPTGPFKLDTKNARKHGARNKKLVRDSLAEVGAFRSIAVDGEGIVRAGNETYAQALALKQTCDIFVDQIGDLGYGINSLEALAMEIPACSCLAPGFAEQFPNHPFIDVQADNLRQELVRLIAQPNLRREIGRKGKEWVKAHHDPVEVVRAVHRLAQIED
ncbi:MAG: glycosyltransferase, partial [candidate division KSB1 bacterium]|nr:glycosyltransferase [candidate division KSB1 bacterium]